MKSAFLLHRRWALVLLAALTGGCHSRAPAPRREIPPAPPVAAKVASDPKTTALVRALASGDFRERNRAAEALVALGPAALGALGAAGDQEVSAHGSVPVSTTKPVVAEILAHESEEKLVTVHLIDPAPLVRRASAEELGRREDWSAVPSLIERLDDADPGVVSASLASLRRLTNRFEDGECAGSEPTEVAGRGLAARWRAWWMREGRLAAVDPSHRSG